MIWFYYFCFGHGSWGSHYCGSWAKKQYFLEVLANFLQNYWIPIAVTNINKPKTNLMGKKQKKKKKKSKGVWSWEKIWVKLGPML